MTDAPIFRSALGISTGDGEAGVMAQVSYMSSQTTAKDVIAGLRDDYVTRRDNNWIIVEEVRCGTGFRTTSSTSEQRIDLFALHIWPSQGWRRVAYEVKISRSDFLAEIKKPRKRAMALMFSNLFYFATPPGLVSISEIPPECGLVEVHPDGKCVVRVSPPWRDSQPPTWSFVASLIRRYGQELAR